MARKRRVELWTETLPDGRIRGVVSLGFGFDPIEARSRRAFANKVRAQVPEGQTVFVHFKDSIRVVNPSPDCGRSLVQVWPHLRPAMVQGNSGK